MFSTRIVGVLLLAGYSVPGLAAIVPPVTYETPTPDNGVFGYQDDTYNGTNSGGMLTGGTGDLTDGVIAPGHWFTTPTPWVGWANSDPTLVFRFASGTILDTVDFYFDNAMGAGAVQLPRSVTLSFDGGPLMITPTITTDAIIGRYSYNLGGIMTSSLTATLVRSDQWVMLTEATFNGTNPTVGGAVPEPASWAMMLGGFGLVGSAMRRRKAGAVAA
jgi:PEP-CTERM motif